MHKPSEDDFSDWKHNPVTQWVMEEIALMKDEYQRDMGEGGTLVEASVEKTALMTAEWVGFIRGVSVLEKLERREDES